VEIELQAIENKRTDWWTSAFSKVQEELWLASCSSPRQEKRGHTKFLWI